MHEISKQIGQRIHTQRLAFPMTLKQLADKLDTPVTFQQLYRYECGTDRITVDRLYEIAVALERSPGYFFPSKEGALTNVNGVVSTDELTKLIDRPDAIRMLHALKAVRNVKQRTLLIEMVETYAAKYPRYQQLMREDNA